MTSEKAATSGEKRRTRSLSSGLVDLTLKLNKHPHLIFDVVIVGSGYGGSVAAQQLAGLCKEDGTPITVCVLERGAEYLPGMFPSAFSELPTHVRYGAQATGNVTGNHEGLFDIRLGADVSALVANGLGGGSLINAGVMLKPDFTSFHSKLPANVQNDLTTRYLATARTLLVGAPLATATANSVTPSSLYAKTGHPPSYPLKFQRLNELIINKDNDNDNDKNKPTLTATPADISIAITGQSPNLHSVDLNACNGCGDCMTGCNVGAKASLDTNLLAQAKAQGAEIYTGASVLKLNRVKSSTASITRVWQLEVVHTDPGLRRREARPFLLKAHKVILAAGTLGSPEILLRSRSDKLAFSNKLGEQFSCNGDNIAAIHKLPKDAHSTDNEFKALDERKVGPTITNMVNVPAEGDKLGFWVQEFAVPAPLKRLFSEIVTTANSLAQMGSVDGKSHGGEPGLELDPCAIDEDAIEKTLLVGLIGHDSADGSLRLPLQAAKNTYPDQEGTLQIVWPQARHGVQINAAYSRLKEFCKKAFTGARVLANPMWRLLPEGLEQLVSQPLGPVLTVHPLGGCPMGVNSLEGAVDQWGCVYNQGDTAADDNWFGSLVVLDGSIVPTSLGANPSLTIAALALRATDELQKKWAFIEADVQPTVLPVRPIFAAAQPTVCLKPQATEVEIVERLSGHIRLKTDEYKYEPFFVELTLAYDKIKLRKLSRRWADRKLKVKPSASCIKIFHSGAFDLTTRRYEFDALAFASDDERERHVVWKAPVEGNLRFLHREESTVIGRVWRGLRAYLRNRGDRDVWQAFAAGIKKGLGTTKRDPDEKRDNAFEAIFRTIIDAFKAASRAGEVRRFDYDLKILKPSTASYTPLTSALAQALALLQAGNLPTDELITLRVKGKKRLTYNRRANPWQQLTTLQLTEFPQLMPGGPDKLTLDMPFLAQQGLPLMRLVKQQNQADALLDMASFGLFMTRVLINIHLWTFRKPDEAKKTKPKRLPGHIEGLPKPEVINLTVDTRTRKGAAAVVRLTRYRQSLARLASAGAAAAPLAMIHGYSVSGNTFTHPSLKQSAAEYFWQQGRDVWIVDLRTSTGLPTASLPWSIEEVALVDIPAALLHIKNATGQRVDLIAHCIGAAMTGMALLTDAQDIARGKVDLGVDTWITETQLGTLAAFNGAGGPGLPHPTVRSVVLSQKGPLLRYTSDNIFRAYLLRSLRRWLVPEGYRFQPRSKPIVSDQIIDRLLSSLPYPKADYDIENPRWPWKRTPWTASRHRMDILYARDFAAANLKNETLHAIDDLFGPINLDTVAQTIHFVRFSCVTNQAGRGEFVTLANLHKRWSGIPTLAIHGAGNGMVDVSTQTLLEQNFLAAAVPFRKLTYSTLEHQDVWIGKTSVDVFGGIEKFLSGPAIETPLPAPAFAPLQSAQWTFNEPWIGPRIIRGDGEVGVYAMSSPRYGKAKLILVPVSAAPNGRCVIWGSSLVSSFGASDSWRSVSLQCDAARMNADMAGWLAVMAYPFAQTTLSEFSSTKYAGEPDEPVAGARQDSAGNRTAFSHTDKGVDQRFLDLVGSQPFNLTTESFGEKVKSSKTADTLNKELAEYVSKLTLSDCNCFISQVDIAKLCTKPDTRFQFLLGSCQYPAGLIDRPLAEKSLARMAELLSGNNDKKPDFVIFTGDQIYADATAGLVDPTRSDERFDLPYEMALRTEPMRQIMRAVPTHMMLDDHEIVDNWEPPHRSNKGAGYSKKIKQQGLKAYWKYQRMVELDTDLPASYLTSPTSDMNHGCASFYFLDTRSQRQHRFPSRLQSLGLFSNDEQTALHAWLLKRKNKVKFIVSPAIILPRRLSALNLGADHAARSDAWEGYPGNMAALFAFIVKEQIKNVVFLSGDEHLSCVATATLEFDGKTPVKIASVHASGLYAPFPFSNAKVEDFVQGTDYFKAGEVHCTVNAEFAPRGDAFARVTVDCTKSAPDVRVSLHQQNLTWRMNDLLGPPPHRAPTQDSAAEIPTEAAL